MKIKEERKEIYRRYYYTHQEERINYSRKYKAENPEKVKERYKKYIKTPNGRARTLLCAYNQMDKKSGRGHGDLTTKWIVDNILSKSCVYCGETDWHKIGCNRIDNSKPHSKDNVEPCCGKCNVKVNNKHGQKKIVQLGKKTSNLLAEWDSAASANRNIGVCESGIRKCCKGNLSSSGGFKWMYKEDYEKMMEEQMESE